MQENSIILPPKTRRLLKNVENMETPILETFLEEVSLILARRKAASLSKKETILMDKINNSVSASIRTRQQELSLKSRANEISEQEREELLSISQKIEEGDLIRIQSIAELAQLHEVSIDAMMKNLGLKHYE